jgi:signal transduction histidine kinase
MAGSAHAVPAAAPSSPAAAPSRRVLSGERGVARRTQWPPAIVALGLVAAAGAVWISLSADFLVHPGWLALQRAELILGPVVVGLYWWKRRPGSRFGPALIAFGLVAWGLVLEGAPQPLLYSIGTFWDALYFLATLWIILVFPAGVVRGFAARAILLAAAALLLVNRVPYLLFSEHIRGDAPIARCRGTCPANAFFVGSHPGLLSASRWTDYALVALAVATAAVLVWRFHRGSSPRRRTLAIGGAVPLVFTLAFAAHHSARLAGAAGALSPLQWTLVAAWSAVAWGFFAALLQAEIFAGRLLQATVAQSLARPPIADVERWLRAALGDPLLRLGFRTPSGGLVDDQGHELEIPPASGRRLTEIARGGAPAAAIVHDSRLEDDPELLLSASAVALLMFENAALEAELGSASCELRMSRLRLVEAGDLERQRLERDLHDGVQQQLVAVRIKAELARDLAGDDPVLGRRLYQLRGEIDEALGRVRELAHEIFPPLLSDEGVMSALRAAARCSPLSVRVECAGLPRRYPIGLEAALYYCCLEALQNAAEHAGPDVHVAISVAAVNDELRFSVRDDGCGFDPRATPEGPGFANMRDRLGAFGGALVIDAARGRGTSVSGSLPADQTADRELSSLSARKSSVAVTRRLTSDSSGRSSFEKIEPM